MNWKKSYNHLMSGVSYFLPFVVGGGIMLACAYLFDFQNANTATFGSSNVFVSWLNQIGGLAMGYMFPIMGAYIAYSIADRPGLLTGMVAGALAANGGSSFLGAVIGGFAAGYIILGLKKLTAGIPRSGGNQNTAVIPDTGSCINKSCHAGNQFCRCPCQQCAYRFPVRSQRYKCCTAWGSNRRYAGT